MSGDLAGKGIHEETEYIKMSQSRRYTSCSLQGIH